MNKERMQSITEIASMLVEFLLPQNEQETSEERMIRKFKEEYTRRNLPTLDWNEIDDIIKKIYTDATIEEKKRSINKSSDNQDF